MYRVLVTESVPANIVVLPVLICTLPLVARLSDNDTWPLNVPYGHAVGGLSD